MGTRCTIGVANTIREQERIENTIERKEKICGQADTIKKLQAELEAYRWIPVGERLPEQGDDVEFLNADNKKIVGWNDYQAKWGSINMRCRGLYTHWRLLTLPETKP